MSTSSYCQNFYPRKIVFEGDTCVAISIDQTKILNLKLTRKRFVEQQFSVMTEQHRKNVKMILDLSKQVSERDKLLNTYKLQSNKINELILFEKEQNQKLRKKVRKQKRLQTIMIGAIGALAGLLILGG